jgi:glutathione peroxidase-family protein
MGTIYEFSAKTLDGQEKPLSDCLGQLLLVVNTASNYGFTPQYGGLEALNRKYYGQGFAVLGFPCNQFGTQEPGSASEIAQFCRRKYNVTFPMFEKIDVNGGARIRFTGFSGMEPRKFWQPERSNGTLRNSSSIVWARSPPLLVLWWRPRISKSILRCCSDAIDTFRGRAYAGEARHANPGF